MPKRKHQMAQASLDNLIPGAHKLTREDQSKGGKISHQRRSAQAAAQRLLEKKLTPKQIKQYELIKVSHGDSPDLMDLLEIIRESARKKDEDA